MKFSLLVDVMIVFWIYSRAVESRRACSPITRHPTEHSTYTPDFSGTVNFTLWQVFCATNANSSEGNFSSSWSVEPHPPKAKSDTNLLDCEYTVDHCPVCRNASITLYNATDYDWGNYVVTISSECGLSNSSVFVVRFPYCNGSPPESTTPNRTLVFAEPHQQGHHLELTAACYGDKDLDHYDERWTNAAGKLLCADDFAPSPGKYTCYRTDTWSMCNFTEHFVIRDYSKSDSGVYCVQAYSVIGSVVGNKSCVDLTVVPQPLGVAIDTHTRHIHLGTHYVSLQFKLANYSQKTQQYINLTFLRDDEVINPTQEGYCMTTTWTDPFDSSMATIELQVPWSKPGKYKMRINYTSDVDTEGSGFSPYDTQIIKVKSDWLCELVAVIMASAGFIIIVACCCCCCCCCYRKRYLRIWKRLKVHVHGPENKRLNTFTGTSHNRGTYGATEHCGELPDLIVDSHCKGKVNMQFLDMCIEEGEIKEEELNDIVEQIEWDYIVQLGAHLLGDERFKSIKKGLTSQGDHNQKNLCRAVLSTWRDNCTDPQNMRQELVRALEKLHYYEMARAVATKTYF